MNRTGAPADTWFLCMSYVCFIFNHTACTSIKWQIPFRFLTGITLDISPLLRSPFYQPVYFLDNEPSFPSDTRERRGRFVGIAEHVGHGTLLLVPEAVNNVPEDDAYPQALLLQEWQAPDRLVYCDVKSKERTVSIGSSTEISIDDEKLLKDWELHFFINGKSFQIVCRSGINYHRSVEGGFRSLSYPRNGK